MVQYLKTIRGYFYKLFKNGKKKRITRNEYKKSKTRKNKRVLIGGNGDPKMLIYCHNRIVDLTRADTNHWQGPIFKQLLRERRIDSTKIKVDTIDIVPGGTIVGDGFSKSFIDSHENEFDIVILPDCGGKWYEFQKEEHTDEKFQSLLSLMIELLRLVKPGGIIMFGKILYEAWFNRLKDAFINASISQYSLYGVNDVKYITITKA
jgi:SAM-dependent methyltransferase